MSVFGLKFFNSTPSGIVLRFKEFTSLINLINLLSFNTGEKLCRVILISHLGSLREKSRLISDAGLGLVRRVRLARKLMIMGFLVDQVDFVLATQSPIWV